MLRRLKAKGQHIKAELIVVVSFFMTWLTASACWAVEALTSKELAAHCEVYEQKQQGEDGIFCIRYIQGFIDGAVATDKRVTHKVANELDRNETFAQRAIRTRVGKRINQHGPSLYAEFCLGEPLPLRAVVNAVVADLLNAKRRQDAPLARDLVYATLRREYPCGQEN